MNSRSWLGLAPWSVERSSGSSRRRPTPGGPSRSSTHRGARASAVSQKSSPLLYPVMRVSSAHAGLLRAVAPRLVRGEPKSPAFDDQAAAASVLAMGYSLPSLDHRERTAVDRVVEDALPCGALAEASARRRCRAANDHPNTPATPSAHLPLVSSPRRTCARLCGWPPLGQARAAGPPPHKWLGQSWPRPVRQRKGSQQSEDDGEPIVDGHRAQEIALLARKAEATDCTP